MSVFHGVPGTYPVKIKKYRMDEVFSRGDTVVLIESGKKLFGTVKSVELRYAYPEPWENQETYEEHVYYTVIIPCSDVGYRAPFPHAGTRLHRAVLTEKTISFI